MTEYLLGYGFRLLVHPARRLASGNLSEHSLGDPHRHISHGFLPHPSHQITPDDGAVPIDNSFPHFGQNGLAGLQPKSVWWVVGEDSCCRTRRSCHGRHADHRTFRGFPTLQI